PATFWPDGSSTSNAGSKVDLLSSATRIWTPLPARASKVKLTFCPCMTEPFCWMLVSGPPPRAGALPPSSPASSSSPLGGPPSPEDGPVPPSAPPSACAQIAGVGNDAIAIGASTSPRSCEYSTPIPSTFTSAPSSPETYPSVDQPLGGGQALIVPRTPTSAEIDGPPTPQKVNDSFGLR